FSIFLSYGKFPVTDKKRFLGECVYDVFDYVHEDDISIRSRLRKFFESGETLFSSELRIKNFNGEYAWYEWYKITGTVIRDKEGNNISFVGKLTDADKQIAEEKNLVQRAENDLLTGVFNKKTMEEKITKLLEDRKTDRYYIFFMVDLDNFKNVNDTLGHIYGDKAICDTANVLSEIFKTNAVVGRLGGDEFAVCAIYDSFDEESLSQYIIKKAEEIRKANLRSYTDGASKVDISSSIGIAVSPNDGTDFQSLYKNADMALYESKKSGKNKYTRFSI
ncbi:MAG: sensor domain-containing diguanylate cyclase, partial [Lachnospiraceae bacterium]|nr:sensor domain-containing diguanylate cyclase [Lachnospiraceae bacterium]